MGLQKIKNLLRTFYVNPEIIYVAQLWITFHVDDLSFFMLAWITKCEVPTTWTLKTSSTGREQIKSLVNLACWNT